MGKKCHLSDFDRAVSVEARRPGLRMSGSTDLLGFSRTTDNKRSFVSKALLMREVNGEWPDWFELTERATVTQITTLYNCVERKSISERTTLRLMGYNSRRPHRVPLLSARNRKLRLQWAQAHQNKDG